MADYPEFPTEIEFQRAQRLADRGDIDASNALGCWLLNGAGCQQDYEAARPHLEFAAKAGHRQSAHHLGWLLIFGDDGAPDIEGAIRWFRSAAESGYGPAMTALAGALIHRFAEAPESAQSAADRSAALKWLAMAHAAGEPLPVGASHIIEREFGAETWAHAQAAAHGLSGTVH